MERIVKDNVVEHLNEYNFVKDSLHGFTRGIYIIYLRLFGKLTNRSM